MGYDHFALLTIDTDCKTHFGDKIEKFLKRIEKICKKYIDLDDDNKKLFGEVHHLSSGCFSNWWLDKFHHAIAYIYKKLVERYAQDDNTADLEFVKNLVFVCYQCTFDGEMFHKCLYEYGKPIVNKDASTITLPAIDNNVELVKITLDSINIRHNITCYYNDEYYGEFY